MRELVGMQTYMYTAQKVGAGQLFVLCASILVPRVIGDDELQRAANELVRINDGLRARFMEGADGKVYQETLPYEERQFEVMHFDSQKKLDAYGDVYATIPMNLDVRVEGEPHKVEMPPASPATIAHGIAHGIATKMKAKRLGLKDEIGVCTIKLVHLPGASGAIVKVHHVVSDGWGMMVLANQFLQLLRGETPHAYQFDEHLVTEAAYKRGKAYKRDLAYFNDMLDRYPDKPKLTTKQATSMVAARVTTVIDDELSAAIRKYAADHNTSPQILFLTAAEALIRHEIGADGFYLGSACMNRSGFKERNTVGMFVNTPFFHVELDGKESFAHAVSVMRDKNFSCIRRQRASADANDMFPGAIVISYQLAKLEADDTAICTQYFNGYISDAGYITFEDRQNEGNFKMHRESNLQLFPRKKAEKDNLFMLKVLREGIADDSKTIDELSA